jgi:hypothetical protein
MTCAIVLYFDRPFEQIDLRLGLTKAAEIRMSSSSPTDDIVVLITSGFQNISKRATARLRELRYRVVDAESILRDVRRIYPYANESRVWRGDPFHEACFLRWLVLERYFGETPILAMDSDVVWRVDPYSLLEKWRTGGSFLCLGSPCLTFIADSSWYQAYRAGLEQLARDPDYGSDYKKSHYFGCYHDQALCQLLVRDKVMSSDKQNLLGHGFSEKYFITSNPIGIKAGVDGPLTFAKTTDGEIIGGKAVPFWHMQSSFTRCLSYMLIVPLFTGLKDFRVPFEKKSADGPHDVAAQLMARLHLMMVRDQVKFERRGLQNLKQLTYRSYLYDQFFNGDLSTRIFKDPVWWREGVWAD